MEQELPQRKHTRLPNYDYSLPGYYFVTICTRHRAAVFADPAHKLQLTPAGEIARNCMIDIPHHIKGVTIDTFCVMHDHVHAIVVIESVGPPYMAADCSKQTLCRAMQQYRAAVSRSTGIKALWQDGFYDHILRNDLDLSETRRYIVQNPSAQLERRLS